MAYEIDFQGNMIPYRLKHFGTVLRMKEQHMDSPRHDEMRSERYTAEYARLELYMNSQRCASILLVLRRLSTPERCSQSEATLDACMMSLMCTVMYDKRQRVFIYDHSLSMHVP